ncbi:hypothetical protein Patl1_36571 [Pistacia atlantica]|nr:hypothetical protein Patl1_36571 [Pistacia atlantica]
MDTSMNIETAPQIKPPLCITKISTFFHLPNPRIFLLFIISSTVTFTLGIAMILEWYIYSRHHPGYQLIVYYAPCVISLPILLFIMCVIHAILLSNKGRQNLHIEPPLKQSEIEETGQVENVEALQNQLALVPIEPFNDQPSGSGMDSKHTSLALVAQPSNVVDNKSALKKTYSLPLVHKFNDRRNIKRRMSFG